MYYCFYHCWAFETFNKYLKQIKIEPNPPPPAYISYASYL